MSGKLPLFLKRAWRGAAIYRCCVRFGKDRDWAIEKIREIAPDGSRDHLVHLWFVDIEQMRARRVELSSPEMDERPWMQAA